MLAETSLECSYVYFFQVVLLPCLIGSELFWQFLSARITDTSPRHAKTILVITSVSQVALDVLAFFLAKYSKWLVFTWFILRFAAQQQVGNSAGKILKMRIEWVLQIPQEKQLNYFNSVIVTGELMGRGSAVLLVYAVGVWLGRAGYSFYTIRNVFFAVLWFWDLVCLFCTFLLPISYFLPEDRLRDELSGLPSNSVPLDDDDDAHFSSAVRGRDLTSSDDGLVDSRPSHSLATFVTQAELDSAYVHELELGENHTRRANRSRIGVVLGELKDYFVNSGIRFWENGPLVFSAVHLWAIFMLVSFVNIVLKFHVSEVGIGIAPSRSNLCANQFVNVLSVGISENTATLMGVLVYNFGMSRVKPHFFYNKIFVGIAVLFNILFISIFWKEKIGAFGSAVILGALYIGLYLVQTYDGNVSAAWSDPTIIAFVFAMQGSFAQLLALVPIIFAALRMPDAVVLTFCAGCTTVLAVGSFWYSRSRKQQILLLSDPDIVNHDELGNYEPLATIDSSSFAAEDDEDGLYSSSPSPFNSPEDIED